MIFLIKSVKCIHNILYMLNKNKENYAKLYKEIGLSHETLQTSLRYLLEKKFIGKEDHGHKKSFYKISEKGKEYFELLGKLKGYEE